MHACDHLVEGDPLRVLDVHAHLHDAAAGQGEAERTHTREAAAGLAHDGRYLARDQADGSNPGLGFIRVAIVHDQETTAEALHRLVAALG